MKTVSLGVSTVVDIENTAVFNLSPETCGLLIKHLVGGLTETGVGMLILRAEGCSVRGSFILQVKR